jgi:ribonuclease VapC
MFLDASAIVAILAREPDADSLTEKLEAAKRLHTSPVAIYEAVLGLTRAKKAPSVEAAQDEVGRFLDLYDAEQITITGEIGAEAIGAFQRFGRGRHRASLNMGDCFSYACAKIHKVPLLFKGDDFIHTDISIA